MKLLTSKPRRQAHQTSKQDYTLVDMFKFYPYKDVDFTKQQGRNYISKKDIVAGHEYSLTLSEWKNIVTACFRVVLRKVISGEAFDLPYGFGKLYMCRKIPKKLMFWEDYSWSDGWKVFMKWRRTRITPDGFALRFVAGKQSIQSFRKAILADFTLINRYPLK